MKIKKTPLRRCLVTGEMCPKPELLRVVKTKDGALFYDATGKVGGRGAYLKKDLQIIEQAQKKRKLEQTFKLASCASLYDRLKEAVATESEGSKHERN